MANYVAASAFGDHTHTLVCRVFGNLMAARTDGAGCNGGRLPEAGDWAGDVHRDAARAPGRTKAGTADQRQSGPPRRMFQTDILCFLGVTNDGHVAGIGVNSSKGAAVLNAFDCSRLWRSGCSRCASAAGA